MKLREVEIETHTVCNARCRYCAYPRMAKSAGNQFMTDELFEQILSELDFARKEIERIHLHHVNEPFVNKKIASLVGKARKAFPDKGVGFSTNAILMTPERAESVLDAGLNLLYTTIPSSKGDVYNHIMGVKTDVRKVMENVGAFIEMADPDVRIVVRSPLGFDEGLNDYFGKYDQIVMEHVPFSNRLGKIADDVVPDSHDHVVNGTPTPCSQDWIFNSLIILHNGDVPLCCNDQEHTHIIGDIRNQSIETLWNSPQYAKVRGWMKGKNRPTVFPCNICEYGCKAGE